MSYASYGGIGCIGDVRFTLKQGVTPSSGSIVLTPGQVPPTVGDLVLADDYGNVVRLRNMFLIRGRDSEGDLGRAIHCTIVDKRVWWKNGYVSGRYNVNRELIGSGSERAESPPIKETSLKELLTVLFDYLGEDADLRDIPDVYPQVIWDYTKPAEAIMELVDKYSLSVGLKPNGQPIVQPANADIPYPAGVRLEREASRESKVIPSEIIIVGGKEVFQNNNIPLVPMGLDFEGTNLEEWTIKEIDDLSYTPSIGWGKAMLKEDLESCWSTGAEWKARLARAYIFRTYGVYDVWREYDLPFMDYIPKIVGVGTDKDNPVQIEQATPIVKVSKYETDGISGQNETEKTLQKSLDFKIDNKLGLVMFNQPVFKVDNIDDYEAVKLIPADVELTYASKGSERYEYSYPLGGAGLPEVKRDDSLRLYYRTRSGVSYETQKDALDERAGEIARAVADKYTNLQDDYQVTVPWIYPEVVSGRLKSISWRLGEDGYESVLSYGKEEIQPFLPTYEERLTTRKSSSLHFPAEKLVIEEVEQDDYISRR